MNARKLNRYIATILTVWLTGWLFCLTFVLLVFGNDHVLTMRVAGITLLCAMVAPLFYAIEHRTRWSTDSIEPTVIGD